MKFKWERFDCCWWCCRANSVGVCKELDGKWHSYVTDEDTIENSPSFETKAEAIKDAQARKKSH